MKIKITKAIGAISIVCAIVGILLCAAGAIGHGSLSRVIENMGGKVYYYDNRNDRNSDYYEYGGGYGNDDIEDFFNDFMYGGDSDNEASL
jgi:hypothetical protein